MSNATGNLLLFYATRDGQARRIASRISGKLAELGITAPPLDLAEKTAAETDLTGAGTIVVIASVRYGKHQPEAEQFLSRYGRLASPPPIAIGSVNLTARKAGKDTPEGNVYLRKWLKSHDLTPSLAMAIAGRLDYRRYRWLDRQMIRLIMKITGGPTDPNTCVEYTPWNAVDVFAGQIAGLFRQQA